MSKFSQELLNKIAEVVTLSHKNYSALDSSEQPVHVTVTAGTVTFINNGTTLRRSFTFTLDFPFDLDNAQLKQDEAALFSDFSTVFDGQPHKLAGTVIYDPAEVNYFDADVYANAFDGNLSTRVNINPTSPTKSLPIGLDLGSEFTLTKIRFAPDNGHGGRLIAGYFEASNNADFTQSTVLYTINGDPGNGYSEINVNGKFRYVRYVSPPGSSIMLAELEFYGY